MPPINDSNEFHSSYSKSKNLIKSIANNHNSNNKNDHQIDNETNNDSIENPLIISSSNLPRVKLSETDLPKSTKSLNNTQQNQFTNENVDNQANEGYTTVNGTNTGYHSLSNNLSADSNEAQSNDHSTKTAPLMLSTTNSKNNTIRHTKNPTELHLINIAPNETNLSNNSNMNNNKQFNPASQWPTNELILNPHNNIQETFLSLINKITPLFFSNLFGISATVLIWIWICNYRGSLNSFYGTNAYNLHPFLMTVVICLLLPQSFLIRRYLPINYYYHHNINYHRIVGAVELLIQLLSLGCVGVSIYGVSESLNSSAPWLFSFHSWCGLLAGLSLIIETIIILFMRLFCSFETLNEWNMHMLFSGLITYLFCLAAFITGIQEWLTLLQTGNSHYYPGLYYTGGLVGGPGNGQPIDLWSNESIVASVGGFASVFMLGSIIWAIAPLLYYQIMIPNKMLVKRSSIKSNNNNNIINHQKSEENNLDNRFVKSKYSDYSSNNQRNITGTNSYTGSRVTTRNPSQIGGDMIV